MSEPFTYATLQRWARAAAIFVYRDIDITAASRVRVDQPAILAANHQNALGDIAIIVAKMQRFPQFLASATWWKNRAARILFGWGGVVPIHRRRDSDTSQNESTFSACNDALKAGAHLCIFPEGEMQQGHTLLPVKTGAARIALSAAETGVRNVAIIPVGLVYEDMGRVRSDAEIHYGEPIRIDEFLPLYRSDPAKAVHDVTALLADRLAEATVNHGSEDEKAVVDRAAQIVLAGSERRLRFARRNALRRAIAKGIDRAGGDFAKLSDAVEAHDQALTALDADFPAAPSLDAVPASDRQRLDAELLFLAAPAALGALVNGPTMGGAWLAGRGRAQGWQATYKGVAGTFLSPIVWGFETWLLTRRMKTRRAVAIVAAGAVSAPALLAFGDRYRYRKELEWQANASQNEPAFTQARATADEVVHQVGVLL